MSTNISLDGEGSVQTPRSRRLAAANMAKTFGRSFKIRKSQAMMSISASLFNNQQTSVVDPDIQHANYISSLPDNEVQTLYASKLEDLIEKDSLKEQLRKKSTHEMRTFLMLYKRGDISTQAKSPTDIISQISVEKNQLENNSNILNDLLISLKNEGLSWIKQLQNDDILILFKNFVNLAKKLKGKCNHKRELILSICCSIRIVHVIANTGYGFNKLCAESALLSLAIYFVCLILNEMNEWDEVTRDKNDEEIRRMQKISLDLLTVFIYQDANIVLINMQAVAKSKSISKFQFIVDGLVLVDEELKNRYLTFLNSLFTCKGYDVYYRIQVRSELSRIGLFRHLTELSESNPSEHVQIAVDRFQRSMEEDYISFNEKHNFASSNFDDPSCLFKYLFTSIEGTASEKHLMSMLHHLLLIRDDSNVRNSFYNLFDNLISRVIMSKNMTESDYDDFLSGPMGWEDINDIIHKSLSTGSCSTVDDLRSLASQNRTSDDSASTNEGTNADQTICPSCPNTEQIPSIPIAISDNHDIAIPDALCMPPPPPPLSLISSNVRPQIPSFLDPKQKYNVNIALKRVAWNKVNVMDIKKSSLWANVHETKYADDSFCKKLYDEFTLCNSKTNVKQISNNEDEKLFHFLDAKTGQNLAILMSFMKVSPSTIRDWIVQCNDSSMSLNTLEQIQRCIPNESVMSKVRLMVDKREELQDPEKLIAYLSEIPMLSQRLQCMTFKKIFPELFEETKSSMQISIKACRKIRKSNEFKVIMEVLLLTGNYLNCGTKNYDCAYGFGFEFLPKVISTRTSNNDRTLLHFVLDIVNKYDASAIEYVLSLQMMCDAVSRVDPKEIENTICKINTDIQCVENTLSNHKQGIDDHFYVVMQEFLSNIKSSLTQLFDLQTSMNNEYRQLAEYLTFDIKQINEFFSNLQEFISHVKQCKTEADAARRANEKRKLQDHVQVMIKQRKVATKQNEHVYSKPVVGDEDENVMERLLAALKEPDACFAKARKKSVQVNSFVQ